MFKGKVTDLIGLKCHHLMVIGRGPPNPKTNCARALWVCLCDCGRLCIKESAVLRKGIAKTCSHGLCPYYKAMLKRRPANIEPKVEWELSMDDVLELQEATNHECHLCGIPVEEGKGGFARKCRTGAYSKTNTIWCCWQCARAYQESKEEFHEWLNRAKRTYKRHFVDMYEDD
jgi:hypothetical protein